MISSHRGQEASVWRDPDKRRAALLSLALHLAVLLLMLYLMSLPRPEPLPAFIVIDVGTPAFAEETVNAATAESPAMPAPAPQVASVEVGDPQALSAPQLQSAAPEPTPVTIQPPAPQAPPAQAAPEVAETAPEVVIPPTPQVQASSPPVADLPLAEAPQTALPEIDLEVLDMPPTPTAITIPLPEARAVVAESRALTTPAATANVTPSVSLNAPAVSATVPDARPIQAPAAEAAVAAAVPLATPAATAAVTPSRPLDAPDVRAAVGSAVSLSAAGASAAVSGNRPLAPPAVTAVVGTAVPLDVAPSVAVAVPRPLGTPAIRAEVLAPEPAAGAPNATGGPPGATDVAATAQSDRPPGGNAATSGQTGPLDPNATADGRGLAAGPDGVGAGTGAPAPSRPPSFSEQRERAISVLLDNSNGYPQQGLAEASMIVEMPVEGGITRLMASYDRRDPVRVGPVRSARDYFVELAQRSHSVLVHDGGSPGAMVAISLANVPTLNAYNNGNLFARSGDRNAPYNLYSGGDQLRSAVTRLVPERIRLVPTTIFRPTAAASQVTEVSVSYGSYTSGFRFDAVTGRYRWIRAGAPANHPDGQVIQVQAVLVGEILARPLSDDREGRLYIPMRRGAATLYLEGRAESGFWDILDGSGITFYTAAGERVDLAMLQTWVILAPNYQGRVEQ